MNASVDFRLYLITGERLAGGAEVLALCQRLLAAAAEELPPGQRVALQLRAKTLATREIFELALKLAVLCRRFGARLLVNDRIDIALAAEADGVHLPSAGIPAADARALMGPERLVGVSTHSVEEVRAAAAERADFVVFGPLYRPISKAQAAAPLGPDALKDACRAASIPVFGLGGVSLERIEELHSVVAGVAPLRVAAIGALFAAEHPEQAMRALLRALYR